MMLLIYIKIFLLFINIGFTYSIQIVKYISEITKFNQNGVLKVVRKPVEFEHYFHPVSQKWKVATRKKFQLDFNKFSFEVVRDDNLTKLLNTPYEKCVVEIKKENCLYRALSILLCGDERYQRYLRHLIFEYIRENREYLEKILGKYKIEDYLWYHFSINPGVTIIPDDIELYAAATFLNVGIYKYDYDTKEWDFYHKDLPDYISLRKSQFEFRVIADKLSDSVSEKKSKKVIKKTAEIESNMVYLNESKKV
ncbi:uncharacterized protein LOC126901997 [Daktulosphaira vitifoliae]|uniref:uncharacterized protein LOC126901997 n=1 Tax=Daktulosphaira vitifoliae TaxID=58002 RepID=UPI0021AB08ED|nr:uncharacterized protein LOC126901997 [Daktulosphaira vitifoliae]